MQQPSLTASVFQWNMKEEVSAAPNHHHHRRRSMLPSIPGTGAVPCSALHAAGVVTCCWRIYPWLGQEPSFKTQSSSLSRRQNLKLRKKNSFVRFANAKKGISPKTLTTATKVFIISSSLYAAILIFMTV